MAGHYNSTFQPGTTKRNSLDMRNIRKGIVDNHPNLGQYTQ